MEEAVKDHDNKAEELTKLTQKLEESQAQLRIETANVKILEDKLSCLRRHSSKVENLLATENEKLNKNTKLKCELEPKILVKKEELCQLMNDLTTAE